MRKSVLLAVAGATLASAIGSASTAGAINYVYNGNIYDVTTLTGTFDDLATQLTATHNALWGDYFLSIGLADVVGTSEGLPNGGYGPLFAYNNTIQGIVQSVSVTTQLNGGSGILENVLTATGYSSSNSYIYATATAVPWETDALPVIGSTILFVGGLWARNKFAKPLQK